MDLTHLISDPSVPHQVVEVYVCPERVTEHLDSVPIGWKHPIPVSSWIQTSPPSALHEYHHRDLVCCYDQGSDSHRVVRKKLVREMIQGNLYATCHVEEVIPIHRFPCTQEITQESKVQRWSMRLNNRMFLQQDLEDGLHYFYLRYLHAPNVDIKKMQEDMDKAMRRLTRSKA